jgi:hypothetical protein
MFVVYVMLILAAFFFDFDIVFTLGAAIRRNTAAEICPPA